MHARIDLPEDGATPAAIAAKIVHPERVVVSWNGDGCFQMNGQEIATAVQYSANVIFIVVDNGMYGTIRMHQERHFAGRSHGTALQNPDFAALALAYGGQGYTVKHSAEFEPALTAALAFARSQRLPALIELQVDPQLITPGQSIADLQARSAA